MPARAGRLGPAEKRAALAAPAATDGFDSRRYRVGDLDLHVRERPGSRQPPCVLLHGLAVSHRYLMPTARCLTDRQVLVPDLPGFGLSTKPTTVYPVDAHADTVARWLDVVGLRGVCLLGNSFGCQVAVALAVARPDLVRALVLVGPTVDPAARSSAGQALRWIRDTVYEDKKQGPILARDVRDAGLRRVLTTLHLSTLDRIEVRLPRLRMPTMFVRGARDRIVPQRWLTAAAALVPGSSMLVIAGAAHNAVTTAGPELAASVDDFLDRQQASDR